MIQLPVVTKRTSSELQPYERVTLADTRAVSERRAKRSAASFARVTAAEASAVAERRASVGIVKSEKGKPSRG